MALTSLRLAPARSISAPTVLLLATIRLPRPAISIRTIISGVFTTRDEQATAQLVMHFILPESRGRGLAALFYEAGIAWARHRSFRRVTVAARESNAPSLGAMRAAGFHEIGREPHTWPDGATEDEIWFEMTL